LSILAILSIFSTAAAAVGDDLSWSLDIVLLARHMILLFALGLISRI
jgi:hypothetical protein